MAREDLKSPTSAEPDWTDQVADLVVDLVESVRDKTTGPILKAARGLVFGTVAIVMFVVIGVIGIALAGRALSLLPIAQWLIYLILGLLVNALGFFLWSKRFSS